MEFEQLLSSFPAADVERARYLRKDLSRIPSTCTPQSMLDMGAGSGSMSAVVALMYPGINGILVDVVSRLEHLDPLPSHYRANLQFEMWPCRESLRGMQFDLVMSMDVMEHIPNWKQSLAELMDFVSPNGFLYVQAPSNYPSPNWPTKDILVNRLRGVFGKHNPADHVRHGLSCKSILDEVSDHFEPLVASESYVVDGKCHCSFKPRTHLLLQKKSISRNSGRKAA